MRFEAFCKELLKVKKFMNGLRNPLKYNRRLD